MGHYGIVIMGLLGLLLLFFWVYLLTLISILKKKGNKIWVIVWFIGLIFFLIPKVNTVGTIIYFIYTIALMISWLIYSKLRDKKNIPSDKKLLKTYIILWSIILATTLISGIFVSIMFDFALSPPKLNQNDVNSVINYSTSANNAYIAGIIGVIASISFGLTALILLFITVAELTRYLPTKKYKTPKKNPWTYIIFIAVLICITAIVVALIMAQSNINSAEIAARSTVDASKPWWERLIIDKIFR